MSRKEYWQNRKDRVSEYICLRSSGASERFLEYFILDTCISYTLYYAMLVRYMYLLYTVLFYVDEIHVLCFVQYVLNRKNIYSNCNLDYFHFLFFLFLFADEWLVGSWKVEMRSEVQEDKRKSDLHKRMLENFVYPHNGKETYEAPLGTWIKKKFADAISYVRLIMSYVRHNYLVRTTYYVVRTT